MIRVQYLDTAALGLKWVRDYFRQQKQLNDMAAFEHYRNAIALLKQQPLAGRCFDGFDEVRELNVKNTAFSILYIYKYETIFVIDIRDQRGMRSAAMVVEFEARLRRKYGL